MKWWKMSSTFLVDLVSLSIASAIGPGQILFSTLLLQSPHRGVLKAGSFISGMTVVRLIQGAVFGFILIGAFTTASASATASDPSGAVVSTLLLVLGIFLLITAYKQWHQEDHPEGPLPKWLTMIDSITPVKAFGIGVALVATSPNLWAFTLNVIALIGDAQLNRLESTAAFLLFILIAESLVLLAISIRVFLPKQATKTLKAMSTWLNQNNRALMIGTSLVFGLYFLSKGIMRFLAY
jgi:hypothetical protein